MILSDKLEAAMQLALRTAPYLRDVLAAAKLVISPGMPSPMACDKYWRVYINPRIEDIWSAQEMAWVLLHEAGGHLVRGHYKAAETHPTETWQRLNIAQDLEIESWEWPGGYATRPSGEMRGLHPDQFGLPVGETWQFYLENLPKGAEAPYDCGSGSHGTPREWEHGPGDAPVMPNSARERAIQNAAAGAIQEAAKGRGDIPEGLAIWADAQLTPPKVDWRRLLRRAVSSRLASGAKDMLGPGKEKHGLLIRRWRAEKPKIAIVADTSGSMHHEAGTVLGACVQIARVWGSVDVCWIDVDPVWQKNVGTAISLRPTGGGGTDLRPAILEARRNKYDAIIIITDCQTPWPDSQCHKSIVVATGGGTAPENWRTINVD